MTFPTQDEDRDSVVYSYSKPVGVDAYLWVKQHMRLLEVRDQLDDRVALFEEFFVPSNQ